MKKPRKYFNDKDIFFTPVIVDSGQMVDGIRASTIHKDESLYFYPGVLTSYDYWKNKFDEIERSDTNSVICDSGAIQVKSRKAEINPTEVAKFYDANESIKIGIGLDDIPVAIDADINAVVGTFNSLHKFREMAHNTLDNLEKMAKVNPDVNLYNILQIGKRFNQGKEWYKIVSDIDLDGWCLAVKPASEMQSLVFGLAFLAQKGAKNVHILGRGGMPSMAVIMYAKNWFDNITFDCSEPAGYRHWQLRMPYNFNVRVSLGTEKRNENITKKRFPCTCPICKNITIDKEMPGSSNRLYELHNIYQRIMLCRQLDFLRGDKKLYKKFLNHKHSEEMVDMFDECMEKGVDDVAKGSKSGIKSLDEL